ncbi:MAG: hypothetical protein FWE94_05065 [Coriobacteriia bacterium]|nr:hypothetical protein [Coriobacteriia bacterium]
MARRVGRLAARETEGLGATGTAEVEAAGRVAVAAERAVVVVVAAERVTAAECIAAAGTEGAAFERNKTADRDLRVPEARRLLAEAPCCDFLGTIPQSPVGGHTH